MTTELPLADIIEDCIQRMAKGASIEDCVRIYPQHRRQLLRLLTAGQSVTKAGLAPDELTRAQMRLMPRFEDALRTAQPSRRVMPRWAQMAAAFAGVLLAGGLLTGGFFAAASHAQPGDALYGVRLLLDPSLNTSPEALTPEFTPEATVTYTASPTFTATVTMTTTSTVTYTPSPTITETPSPELTNTLVPSSTPRANVTPSGQNQNPPLPTAAPGNNNPTRQPGQNPPPVNVTGQPGQTPPQGQGNPPPNGQNPPQGQGNPPPNGQNPPQGQGGNQRPNG